MIKLVLPLLCLLFHATAFAGDIVISVDGKKIATANLDTIKTLRATNIEFFNHVIKRAELYKGVPTLALIEKYYPEVQNVVEVELISENGFKSFFHMDRFLQVSSILAYERADGDKFVRYSSKEKILVPLGPLYLVWLMKGLSEQDRLNYRSIYQIAGINLVTNKAEFGVKENSVDGSIYLGYQTYKAQCISCHALGKVGGDISFDLVKHKTVDNKSAEYVIKYILNPTSVNPRSKMLPLPKFKNSNEMAKGVVDFLKFMQNPEELLKKKKEASADASYKELRELVNSVH